MQRTKFMMNTCLLFSGILLSSFVNAKMPAWESYPAINKRHISPIYQQEWKKSPTKDYCPILALANTAPSQKPTAKARRANFWGGWGVAYDLSNYQGKKLRSAYGIANSGYANRNDIYHWNNQVEFSDGSFLTYGREGGDTTGNQWLAYLILPDGCFYNIWSNISKQHLTQVIDDLRFIQ